MSDKRDRESILVVGAGLVGSLLSIYLAKLGHQVEMVDRNPDPRSPRAPSFRSINLTICERGFTALDRVGAGDLVRAISVPCYGRVIHSPAGEIEHQPYGNRREALYSVSRRDLNQVLLNMALAQPGVSCSFAEKCLEVDLTQPEVTFQSTLSGEISKRRPDRLFGADGAFSAVRQQLQRMPRFNYSQEYLDQAYKELHVPASPAGDWVIDGGAIHIWPRGHYMLIGFPNLDRSFTFSLHMPYTGEPSFASIRTREDLLALFRSAFPDALPLMPTLVEDFFGRPEAAMVTIRCLPWTFRDRVALIGDSAHAIVPSYGQGANSGFEDCSVLYDCLRASGTWLAAFEEYEKQRLPNAEAIADLALEHFSELRDKVGDPEFLLRKEIERRINERYPDRYTPLYSLISFTNLPYAEAMRQDREQRSLVDRVLALPRIRERLESDEVWDLIDRLMAETACPAVEQPCQPC
ncbi:MAG: kynurenine 3-monooxygenase [Acidobacteriota bacterium]|jgi:kynurenine 3-monooxygenase|nr:kynurenine 3-monooxygenase [Acidobacteriota bacterium]